MTGNAKLIAICEACKLPVQPDKGSLYILQGEINRVLSATGAYDRNPAARKAPEPGVWHLRHDACGSQAAEGSYEIDIQQIATWEQLMDWAIHLGAKRWLKYTTWAQLVKACVVDGDGLLRVAPKPVTAR